MKKFLIIVLILSLLLAFSACGSTAPVSGAAADSGSAETASGASGEGSENAAEEASGETVAEEAAPAEEESDTETDLFKVTPYTGEQVTVRLGCLSGDFSLNTAYSMGFLEAGFKGSNADFTLTYYEDDAAVAAALAAGEIDLAVCSEQTVLTGALYGSGCQIIGRSLLTKANVPLMAYTYITSPDLLKGESVALVKGSWCHFLLLQYLESIGLKDTDVYIIDTDVPTNPLTSGLAHAAVNPDADYSQLIEWNRVYALTDDIAPDARALRVIAGRSEFCEQHPEVVAGVLQIEQAVVNWACESEENLQEAAVILSDISGESQEELLSEYTADKLGVALVEEDMQALRSLMEFMSSYGQFPGNAPGFDETVSTEYLTLAGLQ